jgi:hypothetical protein
MRREGAKPDDVLTSSPGIDPEMRPQERLETDSGAHGITFWIGLAVGWVAILIGLFGIFDHASQANPFKVFRLLIGLNIFNDAVVVPLVLGLAFAVHRWAPRWLLVPAQVWLIIWRFRLLSGFEGKARVRRSGSRQQS